MTDAQLRQRIAYLVQHGGLYPDEPKPQPWRPWAWAVVILQLVILGAIMLQ